MAVGLPSSSSLSTPPANPVPRISPVQLDTRARVSFLNQVPQTGIVCGGRSRHGLRLKRLNAGFSEIEPDLNEDPKDRWATPGIDPEDFVYGEYDGHHTYFEGEETGTFWGTLKEEFESAGPPTGFQGFISWIFLPAIAAGMYFNVPGEYLYIGAGLFAFIFCVIEMDKPDQPHNFEPQIYNMERGARDKMINDYNTMSIWDFNEKYGELWDFTIPRDEITKT